MEIEVTVDMTVEKVVSYTYTVDADNHQQAIDDAMYRLKQGTFECDPDDVIHTRVRAVTVETGNETVELFR